MKSAMGRNKFSQTEITKIRKLLRLKLAGTRYQQKLVRHTLRTVFDFNIVDFGTQGKAFGPDDLDLCLERGRIQILDDATIEAMKAKHAEQKARDAALAAQADPLPPEADWEKVLQEWEAYYASDARE